MSKLDQCLSAKKKIQCGVPQGSTLGPLLFLIYINDLPNCLTHSSASLFADDTNITAEGISIGEIEDKLCTDLENMHQWLLANKLTLNMDKTEYMVIGSKQKYLKPSKRLQLNCKIKS